MDPVTVDANCVTTFCNATDENPYATVEGDANVEASISHSMVPSVFRLPPKTENSEAVKTNLATATLRSNNSVQSLRSRQLEGFDLAAAARISFRGKHLPEKNGSSNSTFGMTNAQREWFLAAANCNYPDLTRLVSRDPTLAAWQDYLTGNTALHFAAKFGDCGLIRFLVGNHHVDVNARNHGGLTSLHLAAQSTREEAIILLMSMYNADPKLRDYSGKRPSYYLPKTPAGEKLKCKLRHPSTCATLASLQKQLFVPNVGP